MQLISTCVLLEQLEGANDRFSDVVLLRPLYSFDASNRFLYVFPERSPSVHTWFKGSDLYHRRVGGNSFEAEGMASGAAVGLAGGEDLEGLSLSAVSSTLASFFLFLAILRYTGIIPFVFRLRCEAYQGALTLEHFSPARGREELVQFSGVVTS